MSVSAAIALECNFGGTAWTDMYADVRLGDAPLTCKYGITDAGPSALVASTGSASLSLDNSEQNSAGSIGLYSPGHVNLRTGFAKGADIRAKFTYDGTAYYKWRGKIADILPAFGTYRERVTRVTAVDWMDQAAVQLISQLPIQTDVRVDEVLPDILADMPVQPRATAFGTGTETLARVFDTESDAKTSVLGLFQKLCRNELGGRIYLKGDTAGGETLTFENHRKRGTDTTVVATLADTMQDLTVEHLRSSARNVIRVRVFPKRVDTELVTIYNREKRFALNPKQSLPMVVQFIDPATKRPISATGVITPLEADTDFKFGSNEGDYGDLNDDLRIITGDLAGALGAGAAAPTMGASGVGDGRTAFSFAGAQYVNIWSPELARLFNGSLGAILVPVRITDAAVWADGVSRQIFRLLADGSNYVIVRKNTTVNQINWLYNAAGTTESIGDTSLAASTDWFLLGMTWDKAAEEVKAYLNGVQAGATATGLGIFAGSLTEASLSQNIATAHKGLLAHAAVFDRVLTAADILAIYNALGTDPRPAIMSHAPIGYWMLADSSGDEAASEIEAGAIGGNSAKIVAINTGENPGWVNSLKLRGYGIYAYDDQTAEARDEESVDAQGELTLTWDLEQHDNPLVAETLAGFLKLHWTDPPPPVTVRFLANASDALMRAFLLGEPGSRITLSEPVTARSADYFINGVTFDVEAGGIIWCEWLMEPAEIVPGGAASYWIPDVGRFSEAPSETIPAP
jgi:hypothetical protein